MKYKTLILFFLLLVVVIVLTSSFSLYLLNKSKIVHVQEMPVSVGVSDYIGLNAGTDSLKFGTIPSGNRIERKINLLNPFKFDVEVFIDLSGDIADWMIVEENNFILRVNETKKISASIYIPEDPKFGNYTGIMRVVMKKYD